MNPMKNAAGTDCIGLPKKRPDRLPVRLPAAFHLKHRPAPNDGVFPARTRDLNAVRTVIREAMTLYAEQSGIPKDADGLPRLEALHEPPGSVLAAIRDGRVLIARRNWKIVGTVRLDDSGEPGICILRRFAVLPGQQGSGIGLLLFNRAADSLKTAGYTEIRLFTNPNNHVLMRFYRRLGFRLLTIDESGDYPRVCLSFQL